MGNEVIPQELQERIWDESQAIVSLAAQSNVTLGTAESCTGGLVGASLTAIPGSSSCVMGGVTSYACSVKRDVLGVAQETLDTYGAVSSQCASQMAGGARRVLACDVAVSVTGIAGPGGAVPGKPVGTVWFGLATPAGTRTTLRTFDGDRAHVRAQTVLCALGLLRDGIMETCAP